MMRANGDKIVNRNKPKYKKVKTENALEMQPRKTNSHIRRFAKTSSFWFYFLHWKTAKGPQLQSPQRIWHHVKEKGKKKKRVRNRQRAHKLISYTKPLTVALPSRSRSLISRFCGSDLNFFSLILEFRLWNRRTNGETEVFAIPDAKIVVFDFDLDIADHVHVRDFDSSRVRDPIHAEQFRRFAESQRSQLHCTQVYGEVSFCNLCLILRG